MAPDGVAAVILILTVTVLALRCGHARSPYREDGLAVNKERSK